MKIPKKVLLATEEFLETHDISFITDKLKSYDLSFIPLIGPPGSGKDTIIKSLKIKYFGSGEYFRDTSKFHFSKKTQTHLKTIADFYLSNNGLLLPPKITVTAFAYEILHSLENQEITNTIYSNGWPRTLEQTKSISTFANYDKVFNIFANEETLISRISLRNRIDDSKFETRFNTYNNQTLPIFDYFKLKNIEIIDFNTSKMSKKEMISSFKKLI